MHSTAGRAEMKTRPLRRLTILTRCVISPSAPVLKLSEWPADFLRHSCASYMLAEIGDAGGCARWSGDDRERSYSTCRPDFLDFWAFMPDSPRPEQPAALTPEPITLPTAWGVTIDPGWPRFVRAEVALRIEPTLRSLARQKQREAGYYGGVTGQRFNSPRIDTIGEVGRLARCSRQTVHMRMPRTRIGCIGVAPGRLSIWCYSV
jgi:hypothetical protein